MLLGWLIVGLPRLLRVRSFRRGGALPCRVTGTPPAWPAGEPGAAQRVGDGLVWVPDGGTVADALDLGGLTVARVDMPDKGDDLTLVCRDREGRRVRVITRPEYVDPLEEALRRSAPLAGPPAEALAGVPLRAARRAPLPWWVVAPLALSGVLVVAVAWVALSGERVTATVRGNDQGFCSVAWPDPWDGRPRSAGIDCGDDAAGDRVRIVALNWPFRGEAVDLYDSPQIALGAAGVLGVAGTGGLIARTLRRRRPAGARQPASLDAPIAAQRPLPAAPVRLDAVTVAALVRRAPASSAPIEQPRSAPVGPWRAARWRIVRALGWPVAAVAFVGLLSAPYWTTSYRLATSPVVATTARVVEPGDAIAPFMPHESWAAVRVADREVEVLLVHDRPLRAGDVVAVEHAAGRPSSVRVVGDSGARDATTRSLVALGLAGALGSLPVWRRVQQVRSLRGLSALPAAERLPFVVLPGDEPCLLLFQDWGGTQRVGALPLDRGDAGTLPVSGTAAVHGPLDDGWPVLPRVDGRIVWPAGPVALLDPDDLRERLAALPGSDPVTTRR